MMLVSAAAAALVDRRDVYGQRHAAAIPHLQCSLEKHYVLHSISLSVSISVVTTQSEGDDYARKSLVVV